MRMRKYIVFMLLLAFSCTSVHAYRKCAKDSDGHTTWDCVEIPGDDPRYTITPEDLKGAIRVTPEQERKMNEQIFRQKLQEEINIRKSQDFRLDDADALAEILAGKPRRF